MEHPFSIPVTISDDLIIPPYEHVHHAQALRFLEEARVEFLRRLGFPLEVFFNQGLFLVVTAIDVQYKREIGRGEYRATCENPQVEGKCATVDQRILNAKGKNAVEAVVAFMCLSGSSRRAVPFPDELLRAFEVSRTAEQHAERTRAGAILDTSGRRVY